MRYPFLFIESYFLHFTHFLSVGHHLELDSVDWVSSVWNEALMQCKSSLEEAIEEAIQFNFTTKKGGIKLKAVKLSVNIYHCLLLLHLWVCITNKSFQVFYHCCYCTPGQLIWLLYSEKIQHQVQTTFIFWTLHRNLVSQHFYFDPCIAQVLMVSVKIKSAE